MNISVSPYWACFIRIENAGIKASMRESNVSHIIIFVVALITESLLKLFSLNLELEINEKF